MTTTYPLAWPDGWPRTPATKRADGKFSTTKNSLLGSETKPITVHVARSRLSDELERLNAKLPVLSTNLELRLDGQPRSDHREPADPGVAVYFGLAGKQISLACDKWNTVAANIAAIAKHIDAMRGMARWGVGSIEQMFRGFEALPAPGRADWRAVLGIRPDATVTVEMVRQRRRELAERHHPDRGGNPDQMAAINAAFDAALGELTA